MRVLELMTEANDIQLQILMCKTNEINIKMKTPTREFTSKFN